MHLERIMLALYCVQQLREQIEAQHGHYTGMETPNIQSIVDILTIPDALLLEQLPSMPIPRAQLQKEAAALPKLWSGELRPPWER